VPAEVSDPTFGQRLHDTPWYRERGWTVRYDQALVGRFEQFGLIFDFSETPGVVQGPPLVIGERTRDILGELGYTPAEISELAAEKVVGVWSPGEPLVQGPRRFLGYKPSVYDAKPAPPQPSPQNLRATPA